MTRPFMTELDFITKKDGSLDVVVKESHMSETCKRYWASFKGKTYQHPQEDIPRGGTPNHKLKDYQDYCGGDFDKFIRKYGDRSEALVARSRYETKQKSKRNKIERETPEIRKSNEEIKKLTNEDGLIDYLFGLKSQ